MVMNKPSALELRLRNPQGPHFDIVEAGESLAEIAREKDGEEISRLRVLYIIRAFLENPGLDYKAVENLVDNNLFKAAIVKDNIQTGRLMVLNGLVVGYGMNNMPEGETAGFYRSVTGYNPAPKSL